MINYDELDEMYEATPRRRMSAENSWYIPDATRTKQTKRKYAEMGRKRKIEWDTRSSQSDPWNTWHYWETVND